MGESDHEEKAKHYDNAEAAEKAKKQLDDIDEDVLDRGTKRDLEAAKESTERIKETETDRADTSD